MNKHKSKLILTAAAVAVAGMAVPAFGQARVWNGNGDDNLWSTAANWNTGTSPPLVGDGQGWRFGTATLDRDTIMDNSYEFGALQFANNSGYSISNPVGENNTMTLQGFDNGQTVVHLSDNLTSTVDVPVVFNTANVSGGGTLRTIDVRNGTMTFSDTLTVEPTLDVQKLGSGTLVLGGENVMSGDFRINNGEVRLGTDTSLGTATVVNPTGNTIRVVSDDGSDLTLANPFALSGQGGISFSENDGGDVTLNGPITLGTTASGITTVGGGVNTTVTANGVISGDGGISKATQSTFVSNADNTYTGLTNVGNGTLVLNGSNLSDTLLGGGTLQGTGSVRVLSVYDEATNANPAGVLSPGDDTAAATFTASRADFADGGTYLVNLNDVNSTAGSGWDLLTLDGAHGTANANLDVSAGEGGFTIDISGPGAGFDPMENYAFTIVDAADVTSFDEGDFVIDSSSFEQDLAGGTFSVEANGGDLQLVFTAIPEPATASVLGLAGLMLLRRRH